MRKFYLLSAVVIITLACLIYSNLNYIDVRKGCLIKISHDMLRGDRGSIRSALGEIKKNDANLYDGICKYVDIIYERKCMVVGDNYPDVKTLESDGCYFTGTKIIYVDPVSGGQTNSVSLRKESITKYASLAIDYWNNVNTKQPDLDIF
jgi:hypothetical protein